MNKSFMKFDDSLSLRSFAWLFSAALIASMYTLAAFKLIERGSDYNTHAKLAEVYFNGGDLLPHFLYQIVLGIVHELTGLSFTSAALIVVFIVVFSVFFISYRYISSEVVGNEYLLIAGVFFLLIFHPVSIIALWDKHLYLGYIAPNVYHNLTFLLLKPIALLHFILFCKFYFCNEQSAQLAKKISLIVILTVFSVIAKPNYIIVFLPALLGYVMINRVLLRVEITRYEALLVMAVFIPAILVLAWQYLWFYGDGNKNHIGVNLFGFYMVYSELWALLPKLLLSVAFPVSVVYLMGMNLFREHDFQLALYMFCVSLVFAYVLVDSVGDVGIGSGNFMWSAQIAYFIFLYVCLKKYFVFLFAKGRESSLSNFVPIVVGGCHLIFGLVWYYSNINPKFGFYM